ncbi:MAG: MFS transporter [Acidimicrobiia bacterium]
MTDTTVEQTADEPKPKIRLGPQYVKLWTASVISNLGDGIGFVAYPWLASAITRNPLLIALIAVAQRLPWLVFSLPAGVITDRVDRRRLIVLMDVVRTGLTLGVAFFVLGAENLPSPDEVAAGAVSSDAVLYAVLLLATLLLGFAEVLRDNAAQTILPAIVVPEGLETANGRMWAAEMVANSFAGPPLGSLLIGVAFALPFFVDAGSFAVAAGLVFLLTGDFRARRDDAGEKVSWKAEIGEGFRWLWRHPLLKPMALILGYLNGLGALVTATFVLFAQEVLEVDAFVFALIGTGAAIGGVLGGWLAPSITKRLGSGTSLYLTLFTGVVTNLLIGLTSSWPLTWLLFAVETFAALVWNVITVSLRQTIIPDHLLGRANSVYRFFGWGMMPIGMAAGGLLVWAGELFGDRTFALRLPWLVAAAAYVAVLVYAVPRLTTEKVEAARAEGIAAKAAEGAARQPDETEGEIAGEAISEAGIVTAPPPIDLDEGA